MLGCTESAVFQHPEAEANDHRTRFHRSLQELGEVRSQLHHAADYCEATFLNAPRKQMIENTKEYLCQAIVTVVDHLGTVSANLQHQLSETNSVSETQLRINNLKQKLTTCQQYSHKLALSRLSWNADFPRYQPRYIMQPIPILRRSNAILKEPSGAPKAKSIISSKQEFDTKEEVNLFSYKYMPFLVEASSTVSKRTSFSTPVKDGLVLQPKLQHQLFQFQEKHKLKRRMLNWKPMENNDLKSLIWWAKPTA